jgi:hypothetical protein
MKGRFLNPRLPANAVKSERTLSSYFLKGQRNCTFEMLDRQPTAVLLLLLLLFTLVMLSLQFNRYCIIIIIIICYNRSARYLQIYV